MLKSLAEILDFPIFTLNHFSFTVFNVVVFVVLYLLGKIFIRYIKKFFSERQLTDKQLKIEGREFAIWKLVKQIVWLVICYIGFMSLRLNNSQLDFTNILEFEFFRVKTFHIAVYHFFVVLLIIFAARIIVGFAKVWLLRTVKQNQAVDKGTEFIYVQLTKYFIYSIAVLIAFRSFGLNLDLFVSGFAFLLVGVGLGMQHVFAMYFSGFLLLFEGTIKVGDIIELPLNGTNFIVAKVIEINLRTSKIETRDGMILIIPNNKLTHESVNNWTYGSQLTRFTIPVTVKYGTDLELVKEILVRCAKSHPHVTSQKEIFVRFLNFGLNGIELDVVFWAENNFFIEIHKSDIRFAVEREFRKYNIEIPLNQMVIHKAEQVNSPDNTNQN